MLKKTWASVTKHRWGILICLTLAVGVIFSYANFTKPKGMGDPATFLSFACNISDGEVMYRDFIHFRTPGEYFLNSIFTSFMGCNMNALGMAQSVTWYIISPIIMIIAIGILFRKKYLYIAFISTVFMFIFPIASQLRNAIGFLSIVLFVRYLMDKNKSRNTSNKLLYTAGITVGIDFIFGQDLAVISGFTMVCLSIYAISSGYIKLKKGDFLRLLGGFSISVIIGLLPLIIYLLINGTLLTAAYYTIYYAFLLQPKGMDIPYPGIDYGTIKFYLPLIIFLVTYMSLIFQKANKVNLAILAIYIFSILRFISAAGRSDYGHILFSVVPDLVILSLVLFSEYKNNKYILPKNNLRSIFLVIGFSILMLSSVFIKSLMLFVLATYIILTMIFKKSNYLKGFDIGKYLYNTLFVVVILFVYISIPDIIIVLRDLKRGVFNKDLHHYDLQISDQTKAITEYIHKDKPDYIFSFPIHAYYYSLGYDHPVPFMTFEPQTTIEEQELTIKKLEQNKPEVVIFDPLQAYDLGGSVYMITNYILNNYKLEKVFSDKELLWYMIPKDEADILSVGLNIKNLTNSKAVFSVENDSERIRFGLAQTANSKIDLDVSQYEYRNIRLSISKGNVATIRIKYENNKQEVKNLELGEHLHIEGDDIITEIILENKTAGDIVYNNFILY